MVTIRPVHRALVPVDADAAQRLSAPNYDEFQGDREVWDLLQTRPGNVLKVTMPHCDFPRFEQTIEDGSPAAMDKAALNLRELIDSPLTKIADDVLFVYEVVSPRRPDVRQVGLGGMARTSEIRTDQTPGGSIIRNEGIMPEKAEGRARLITATNSDFGTVNCAVRDESGRLIKMLERIADRRQPDFAATDEAGNHHRVWLVSDRFEVDELAAILADEPAAYVADGNHRSAAAAQLGKESFQAVFFPTSRLRLEPYNRLVKDLGLKPEELLKRLAKAFDVQTLGPRASYRPANVHEIGLYLKGAWHRLTPKPGTYDPANGAEAIDADILQRHFFDAILGLKNPRDKKINYVGGNKDSAWLKSRVDAGDYQFALSLAPVTMDQFVAVCEQNRFMPPKSTWFDPKIRSGLVVALLS
jgi:uncharacterized protein (DUF1015 family)